MILLLSRGEFELSTDHVIDWLDALGGDWVRLNAEDLAGDVTCEVNWGPAESRAVFCVGQREVRSSEVQAVWFRRWHYPRDFSDAAIDDSGLRVTVAHHLMREMRIFSETIFSLFSDAKWLTTPAETRLSKLQVLRIASVAGLKVPDTLIANCKSSLQDFKDRHGRVITKCIGDVDVFRYAGRNWGLYTREITQEDLDALPQTFFPTLLQERLEKLYEVRAFFLDGRFYAMAIFSQNDSKTAEDFRRYNHDSPNRCVPYRLPQEISSALQRLVKSAELTTGSIDLVRTLDGKFVFLEVNPGGQFGMVSEPCNYFLEKKLATYLMQLDAGGQGTSSSLQEPVVERAAIKKKKRGSSVLCNDCPSDRETPISSLFKAEEYPVGYRLMSLMDAGNQVLHTSESNFHRATVYANYPYFKAVSRPFDFGPPLV